jgi:CRISPR-associated protein Cas2
MLSMYVLLVYDIEVARLTKVHKFLKRHLHWVQNSVFEGELTDAQLEAVRAGLRRLVSHDADSVLIYTAREQRWLTRETLGKERSEIGNLL